MSIRRALDRFGSKMVDIGSDGVAFRQSESSLNKRANKHFANTLQEVHRLGLEAIGEDIPNLRGAATYKFANNLKAEQRAAWNSLCGVDDNRKQIKENNNGY